MNKKIFTLSFVLFFGTMLTHGQTLDTFLDHTDTFFKKYTERGLISYKAISSSELGKLTEMIAEMEVSKLEEEQQKAFLINAYNLLVIKTVMEQYPIASPNEITGFFDWNKYLIGGRELSLNELEKDWILETFEDARLHFVLVCAAVSCPAIKNSVYRPGQLEQQLEQQTYLAINDPSFIYLNETEETIYLSEIFRWYAADFGTTRDIRSFINRYRDQPLPADYKIRYYPYNWLLNDLNPVKRSGNPGFIRASRLLAKGQFELKIFNSLYTQKQYDGFEELNSRSSYFSSFIQFIKGGNKRYNWGLDLVIRSHVVNDFVNSSPFGAIQTSNFDTYRTLAGGDSLRTAGGELIDTYGRFGPAHIGPKIKFHPFKKYRNLSFQQTLYLPLDKKVDGQLISFSQLFYDQLIGTRSQLFVEASLWTPLQPSFRVDPFLKVFYSYFPSDRWTIYGMVGLPNEIGGGLKFLLADHVELELLYTNYLIQRIGVNDRIAETFNLGIRIMR